MATKQKQKHKHKTKHKTEPLTVERALTRLLAVWGFIKANELGMTPADIERWYNADCPFGAFEMTLDDALHDLRLWYARGCPCPVTAATITDAAQLRRRLPNNSRTDDYLRGLLTEWANGWKKG